MTICPCICDNLSVFLWFFVHVCCSYTDRLSRGIWTGCHCYVDGKSRGICDNLSWFTFEFRRNFLGIFFISRQNLLIYGQKITIYWLIVTDVRTDCHKIWWTEFLNKDRMSHKWIPSPKMWQSVLITSDKIYF